MPVRHADNVTSSVLVRKSAMSCMRNSAGREDQSRTGGMVFIQEAVHGKVKKTVVAQILALDLGLGRVRA